MVPALCAALRAHPAALLPLAIRTARTVPTDLSRYVAPHLSAVICALLAAKESSAEVRALAAALVARCVAQCSDAAALEALLAAMRAAADGSGDMKAARLGLLKGEFFMYRAILRESCSQFDSLPLTSLTIFLTRPL